MHTKLQKWGNSIGIRLPMEFVRELELICGSEVDIEVVEGRLVITPVQSQKHDIEDLLGEVRDDNLHVESDFGPGSGGEAW